MTTAITYTAIAISALIWVAVALIAVIAHSVYDYDRHSINELRSMVKQRGVSAKRTWKKADYIHVLKSGIDNLI